MASANGVPGDQDAAFWEFMCVVLPSKWPAHMSDSHLVYNSSTLPPIPTTFDSDENDFLSHEFDTHTHVPNDSHSVPAETMGPFDASETRPSPPGSDVPSLSSGLAPSPSSAGGVGTPESTESLKDAPSEKGRSRKGKERATDNDTEESDISALSSPRFPNSPSRITPSPYDDTNASDPRRDAALPDATPPQGNFWASTSANVRPALQASGPVVSDAPRPSEESSMLEGMARQSESALSQGFVAGYEPTSLGAAAGDLQYFPVNQQQAGSRAGIAQGQVEDNYMTTRRIGVAADYGAMNYGVADPNTAGATGPRYNASLVQPPDQRWDNNRDKGIAALRARAELVNFYNAHAHAAPPAYNAMGGHGHAGSSSSAGGHSGVHDAYHTPLQPAVPVGFANGNRQRHPSYGTAQYRPEGARASYSQANLGPQQASQAGPYFFHLGQQQSSQAVNVRSNIPYMAPQQSQHPSDTAHSWQGSVPARGFPHFVEPGASRVPPQIELVDLQAPNAHAGSNSLGHIDQPVVRTANDDPVPPVSVRQNPRKRYPRRGQASSNRVGANPGFQQPQGMTPPSPQFSLENVLCPPPTLQPAREPSSGPQRRQRSTTTARKEATAQPVSLVSTPSEASSTAPSNGSKSRPKIKCPIKGCEHIVVATKSLLGNHIIEAHKFCETVDHRYRCIFGTPAGKTCTQSFKTNETLGKHYLTVHCQAPQCPFCERRLKRIDEPWAWARHSCRVRDERRK
ncbi:hypothetical protein DENSPDRAFT_678401 [Dentipellis sp. KUC8613]|nr:hypothetical protein DENSPDRAFT_678401 [Dentipellis sp. KUC8613]